MNKIQHLDINRVISRLFKLDKTTDPVQSVSSEIIPTMLVANINAPHPADTEVNRGSYDGLTATALVGDLAGVFELFNPVGSGVLAELCSVRAGASYATDLSLHLCTAINPHAGANGLGKFLHLGAQNTSPGGNTVLVDGYDANRLAQTNLGGGFISIERIAANGMAELMCPGIPIFLIPGTGCRVQVKGGTAGTQYWHAAWIERRQIQLP